MPNVEILSSESKPETMHASRLVSVFVQMTVNRIVMGASIKVIIYKSPLQSRKNMFTTASNHCIASADLVYRLYRSNEERRQILMQFCDYIK